jgi:septum site-determining protein MinC
MAKGIYSIVLGERTVTLLRGRRDGLEISLAGRELEAAFDELEARLTERPSFYRDAAAVVNFGESVPAAQELARLRTVLAIGGITLRVLVGWEPELERVAREEGLEFEPRPQPHPRLSEAARSLIADFAGARSDIAQRRRRGEASVPRVKTEAQTPLPALHLVTAPPATLYHAATLRGGQVLHHTGNIVVVGDVNPGAELIATGDVVVFGRLAGIAHAGAEGAEGARIYALDLAATQLRIATFIAAEDGMKRKSGPTPEVALARDGRILILPLDRLADVDAAGAWLG